MQIDSQDPIDMALPHTVGLWGVTESVEIELAEGSNVLRFAHKNEGYGKGFTIKDFTLSQADQRCP